MNTIVLTDLKNRKISLAGSFNELTRQQLIRLSDIIHRQFHPDTKRLMILKTLLVSGFNPFRTWLFHFRLSPGAAMDMFPVTEFALKSPDLTRQLIPSIRIPYSFKKLYGPSDDCKNLVFIEFIMAERNYAKFRKTGEVQFLDNLIAILYRRKKENYNPTSVNYDGDIRERYNDDLVEGRAKKISKLDINIKLAILTYYHGCRDHIIGQKKFSLVFTKEKKDKIEGSSGKHTWEDVLMELAEHKTGYLDSVSFTSLYTILFIINSQIAINRQKIKDLKKRK